MNSDQFVEDAERELYEALLNTEHGILNTVDNALSVVESLIPAINNFFDKVLVMAEDEAVKQNRLALVGKIASLTEGLADLSHLEGF